MTEPVCLVWSSDKLESKSFIGANSETDGAYNMVKVMLVSDWQGKYPAFAWCAEQGEDWYLPSKEELLVIFERRQMINSMLTNKISRRWYLSSTEYSQKYLGKYCIWIVNMGSGDTEILNKDYYGYVRAVSAF